MKPNTKAKVCLVIAVLGLFLAGMGLGLTYGADHPKPGDTRDAATQASRRSMGTTLTWTGLAVTFGSLGLLMATRNGGKQV